MQESFAHVREFGMVAWNGPEMVGPSTGADCQSCIRRDIHTKRKPALSLYVC